MKYNIKYLIFIFLLVPILSIASSLNNENNFLVISDIHLDKSSTHVMEISPSKGNGKNDLDQSTFEKLILNISDNIKNGTVATPKFIILLGDIVGHLRITSESAIESESVVFNVLKKNFPGTPIFYTFGNNDSLKVNYGPFRDQDRPDPLKSPYDVAKTNGGWNNGFLSTGTICNTNNTTGFPCIITEDTKNGFYSAYIKPGFRLISLNTILFSPNRTQVTEQDARDQLQWLNEQLELAQKNRESVLIAMHIPPGNNVYDHSNFWLPEEQTVFLKLIKLYQGTIIGILASHTHAEELKVIKDEFNKNISGVYFIAALSTSHGNEPSAKTFYFSKNNEQWLLSKYDTLHFTMNNSNMIFSKLYDYTHYYCDNLNNDDLSNCLRNITADKMKKYFSAGNPNYGGIMKSPDDIVLIAKEYKNSPLVPLYEKVFKNLFG